MILGAIINSWRVKLETMDLKDRLPKAYFCGARHVELRQPCLGHYEGW
mgnify:CR=1 FL=1